MYKRMVTVAIVIAAGMLLAGVQGPAAGEPSGEEVSAEQPPAGEPGCEKVSAEQPPAGEPGPKEAGAEQGPAAGEPSGKEVSAEQSPAGEPSRKEAGAEQPPAEQSRPGNPSPKQPPAEESSPGDPNAEVPAAKDLSALDIMKQAQLGLYYAGDDGRAVVSMELKDKNGKTRIRKFTMIRLDIEDGGAQKYYTYFTEPSDVRRTSFMVWKEPDKDDARWIYVPALDLVRRISANDKSSSFVGSDFSYEDVSGRHWGDDKHTLLRSEDKDGRQFYVIESIPIADEAFAKKITWVSKDHMLPEREEYYNKKGELTRVFEAEEIAEIEGFQTVTKRRMTNVKKKHSTLVEFSQVEYNIGLDEDLFTERYLKAPPRKYISP